MCFLVYLCNKLDQPDEIYAIKAVSKKHLARKNLLIEIVDEKNIMATTSFEFIVRLRYCLQVWPYSRAGNPAQKLCRCQIIPPYDSIFSKTKMILVYKYDLFCNGLLLRWRCVFTTLCDWIFG